MTAAPLGWAAAAAPASASDPASVVDLVVFAGIVAIVAVAGIGIGILVAPRLGRLTEPPDEDERDDDD